MKVKTSVMIPKVNTCPMNRFQTVAPQGETGIGGSRHFNRADDEGEDRHQDP